MQYISPIAKDNDIVNKKYVDNVVSEINTEIESVEAQIGNPENLETEDKSSLVNAINEVKASASGNNLFGYPIIESVPAHNSMIYFDVREGESGKFVLSKTPLDSSFEEASYFSVSSTATNTTTNYTPKSNDIFNQRYTSFRFEWEYHTASQEEYTKYSKTCTWEQITSADGVDCGSNGLRNVRITEEGKIAMKIYRPANAALKVSIQGVY